MDLTTSYPRSVKEKIGGVVMAARTTDKARAKAHGNVGEYHYNCPMDQALFGFLGADADAFYEAATSSDDDAKVAAYLKPLTDTKTPAEIEGFNSGLLTKRPDPGSESEKHFLALRESVAPERTDVTAWPDLLDLDEKRDVPVRA